MGDKINNVQAMMNNPKQRNLYMLGIGMAVVTLVAGFMYATSGNKTVANKAGANVAKIPSVDSTPAASSSPDYTRKVVESNAQKAETALGKGSSFVPTVVNQSALSGDSPLDSLDKQIKAQKEAEAKELAEKQNQPPVEQPVVEVAQQPAQPVHVQPAQPAQPVQQIQVAVAPPPAPKKYGSDEDYLIMQAITGVSGIKAPKSEVDYVGQKSNNLGLSQQLNTQFNQASVGGSSSSQYAQKGQLLAKAGTILNAILETGINSDEPSPVLAKIVAGDLKGTRLIGKLSVSGEKVVVQFNVASMPDAPTSIKLNSVAVDPGTSRTGLASDVDRHYFLRYGVMLGASFLGGYADAIKQQNQTCTTGLLGGTTCQATGKKTPKEINQEALGSLGKELANEVRSSTRGMKPTITVDAGSPIGILIMDDLYAGQ